MNPVVFDATDSALLLDPERTIGLDTTAASMNLFFAWFSLRRARS